MKRCHFTDLAQKENGFEFCQAFREELDWVIGGKDDTFWFSTLFRSITWETLIRLLGNPSTPPSTLK